jgi:hypothetical protein
MSDYVDPGSPFAEALADWKRATLRVLAVGHRLRCDAISVEVRDDEFVRPMKATHDGMSDAIAAFAHDRQVSAVLGLRALSAVLAHLAEEQPDPDDEDVG